MALVTSWGRIETLPVVVGGNTDHVQGFRLYDASGVVLPITSAGMPVVINGAGSTSATVTWVVADATTEKTVKASNAARKGLIVRNQSGVNLTIKFGATISGTSATDVIPPYTSWDCPETYRGAIYGVFSAIDAGGGGAHVTEW